MKLAIALAVVVSAFLSTLAEPEQSSPPTYTLKGVVVNSVTGDPVRGALVQNYAAGQRSVLAGPDGKFEFEGLPEGSTFLSWRKPGFFSEQQQQFRVGPDMGPVVLKLVPEGVISGRISGEDGESVEGLPLSALFKHVVNGEMVLEQPQAARTNEEGEFRLAGLEPGTYYLFLGPGQTPELYPPSSRDPGAQGFPGIFYPGVMDLSLAAPIQITPGKQAEILFSMPLSSFFWLSGKVSGVPSKAYVNLQFQNATGQAVSTNVSFDHKTQEFRSGWLPQGSYTITAYARDDETQKIFSAVRSVNLNSNMPGLQIVVAPEITIPISIHVEVTKDETRNFLNQIAQQTQSQGRGHAQAWTPAQVMLRRRDGLSWNQFAAEWTGPPEAEIFALQNVPPGSHTLVVNPNGPFYVESAKSGRTDLLREDLSISPGESIQPIEIVLRDDFSHLDVKVSAEKFGITVLVFAAGDDGPQLRPITPNSVGPDHRFGFSLPPGAYRVLAFDRVNGLEYRNPAVLKKYSAQAKDVLLAPNQGVSLELELTHVEE